MSVEQVKQGYKRTEVGVIPEDWEVRTISTVADMITVGFVGSMSHLFEKSGVPLLRGQDVKPNSLDLSNTEFISAQTHSLWKKSALQSGDVVIVRVGASAGMACVIPTNIGDANAASLVVVRPSAKKLDSSFLSQLINSNLGKRRIESLLVGGAQPVINTNTAANFQFACPTLSEQNFIDSALSDVDALLAKLDQLIAKKRDLKQATMQQLLTGQTRLPGFSGEWEIKRLRDVVEIRKGQLITEKDAIHGDIPVIAGGKKPSYFHNRPNRVGKTITISASGASAGYVAFFDSPIFASDCSTISDGKTYSIEFIYFQLLLKQDEIYRAQTGGAQPHIHAVDLMPLEVGMCSLEEQAAIAIVLSDMDTELATLEARRDKTHTLKQGMMQELLTGRIRLI